MRALYGSSIYWLEGLQHVPRPALNADIRADVAIVGGGFTGLWTAFHLLEEKPGTSVVILESEEIGFGASGRNGGFAMTLLDMSLALLRRNHGDDAARLAHNAVANSVDAMGDTVAEYGIDCDWKRGGLMTVATNAGQLQRMREDLEAAEALGLEGFSELSAEQARAEVNSPTYLGALMDEHCAVVNPAKLARGLARVVEEKGATIYETTNATGFSEHGNQIRISTAGGTVNADQVVLATNAWARNLPWFKNKVTALYTYILLTEPLSDEQWESVGWLNYQGIEDRRNFVHYYRRTADGRILWGGSDGVIHAQLPGRSGIKPTYDRNDLVQARLAKTFRHTFPQLSQVRFTHHWGGPVGITGQFLPHVGTLPGGRIHYGHGYNGHGVAPAHTVGQILASRLGGQPSPLDDLCFVDSAEPSFPPDPLLWLGAELTRQTLLRQDRQMDAGKPVGDMDPLLLRLINKIS